jgi:class 3 adenylate cyclase
VALKDDLISEARLVFRTTWTSRDGRVVPELGDLRLGNDAVELDATVLYADMTDSTKMVDTKTARKSAEIYKAYMQCSAKIIKEEGGAVTAYDGDRIMAVFVGDWKNTTAARTALKLQWGLNEVVNKEFRAFYDGDDYQLKHTVGIDTSRLFVSRIGVRNDNDLVWVGRAANFAAKLSAISEGLSAVYITADVYNALNERSKLGGPNNQNMWESRAWNAMNKMQIYRSTWQWVP